MGVGFGEYQATGILLYARQVHSQAAISSSFIRVRMMGPDCLVAYGAQQNNYWMEVLCLDDIICGCLIMLQEMSNSTQRTDVMYQHYGEPLNVEF